MLLAASRRASWPFPGPGRFSKGLGICRQRLILARAQKKQPSPVLGDAIARGVQDSRGLHDPVTRRVELFDQATKLRMAACGQARNVLHNEVPWCQVADQTLEMEDQIVTNVLQESLAHCRKALTGRTAKNNVRLPVPGICRFRMVRTPTFGGKRAKQGGGQLRQVGTDCLCKREVVGMRRDVDGVVVNRADHVEASLLKPKRETPSSGEEVDGDRPWLTRPLCHGASWRRGTVSYIDVIIDELPMPKRPERRGVWTPLGRDKG